LEYKIHMDDSGQKVKRIKMDVKRSKPIRYKTKKTKSLHLNSSCKEWRRIKKKGRKNETKKKGDRAYLFRKPERMAQEKEMNRERCGEG
ncbi:hypothetical protein Q6247_26160, partial [Klebsiella pneumoniae]